MIENENNENENQEEEVEEQDDLPAVDEDVGAWVEDEGEVGDGGQHLGPEQHLKHEHDDNDDDDDDDDGDDDDDDHQSGHWSQMSP